MHSKLFISLALILLTSCKSKPQETAESTSKKSTNPEIKSQDIEKVGANSTDCETYWRTRFPDDSMRAEHIQKIISNHPLTANNRAFFKALSNQTKPKLAYTNALSPIYRLSYSEIGLFSFITHTVIENQYHPVSQENDLISQVDPKRQSNPENYGKIKYYPLLSDSLFANTGKPSLYFYTTDRMGSTEIRQLGAYFDDCLEYFEYSMDTTNISMHDHVLFGSTHKIDLIFETNEKIDALIKSDVGEQCSDCPNSTKLQKTVARIKGTDNVYFIYADTFPLNNQLDTPSRALILVNTKNEVIYVWYEEIDLFGCSCL